MSLALPSTPPQWVRNTDRLSVFPSPHTLSRSQAGAVRAIRLHLANSHSASHPQLQGEFRREASPASTPEVRSPCYELPQQLFILIPGRRALTILRVFTVICLTFIFWLTRAGARLLCSPRYPWQLFKNYLLMDRIFSQWQYAPKEGQKVYNARLF